VESEPFSLSVMAVAYHETVEKNSTSLEAERRRQPDVAEKPHSAQGKALKIVMRQALMNSNSHPAELCRIMPSEHRDLS
jgi:hypothetical protein